MSYNTRLYYTDFNYHLGGMEQPERKWKIGSGFYRYGFNGKEFDKEVSGTTTYDYGFRIYSPALGRFLSVDPLFKSYPWNSTYAFAENDVIRSIDLDGLEKLIVHEIYNKYGQRTQTVLSGIRDKDTKAAINLDLSSKMGIPLAKDDLYVLRHRGNVNGQIFFEGNAGALNSSNIAAIRNAPTVEGKEVNDLPPGTMQQGETTSRGRFYFSPPVDNNNHEFFETQFNQSNSQPITGKNKLMSDFVSGTLINGNAGQSFGLKAIETTSLISRDIDGYISDFKKNNGVNVAFVESVNITIPNNDNRKEWNAISRSLKNKYGASVSINVNANIQESDTGAQGMGRAAGTYGSIQYNVSGVRKGNKNRAAKGAQ